LNEVEPEEIAIDDLDAARREMRGVEGWIRAERSRYRLWLDAMALAGRLPEPARCAQMFERDHNWFGEVVYMAWHDADEDREDVLEHLRDAIEGYADADIGSPGGIEWQSSTSSTSPSGPEGP